MNAARLVRIVAYTTVLAVTVAGVYLITRPAAQPSATATTPTTAPARDHAATAGANGAAPVMLTDSEAQRIGVTYAVAKVGPLGRDVRTVGQVTFD